MGVPSRLVLLLLAALTLPRSLVADLAGSCLGSVVCAEAEVRAAEDELVAEMSTELFQVNVRHVKERKADAEMEDGTSLLQVSQAATSGRDRHGEESGTVAVEISAADGEVEVLDDDLAEVMNVQLLQRDLKHAKALDALADRKPAKAALAAVDSAAAAAAATAGAAVAEVGVEAAGAASGKAAAEDAIAVGAAGAEAEEAVATDDAGSAGVEAEAESDEVTEPVDCSQYGVFCDPKVNCAANPITVADRTAWDHKLATEDGHANLRTWCMVYPMYAVSLSKCIVEDDKIEYARLMYEDQAAHNLTDADAVYCFVAGHCNNTEVTENTTVQESEAICDRHYGDRWKHVGWSDFMGVVARARTEMADAQRAVKDGSMSWSDMLKEARSETDISAMTACAMGNYQCDVFYCQVNYCQSERYRRLFGNLSWTA